MHLPAVRTLVFYGIGLAIVFGLEKVDLSISWWACIPWALLLWSALVFASLAPFTHPRIRTVSILLYVLITGVLCAAFVIQTPSEQVYILDSGIGGWGMDSAERVILPFLAHQGIHHIEGLILSHAHADHIGGAKTILQHIPVDTVYVGRGFESAPSNMAQEIHKMTEYPRQPLRILAAGEIFWLGTCCPSMVLAPFNCSEGAQITQSSNHWFLKRLSAIILSCGREMQKKSQSKLNSLGPSLFYLQVYSKRVTMGVERAPHHRTLSKYAHP